MLITTEHLVEDSILDPYIYTLLENTYNIKEKQVVITNQFVNNFYLNSFYYFIFIIELACVYSKSCVN